MYFYRSFPFRYYNLICATTFLATIIWEICLSNLRTWTFYPLNVDVNIIVLHPGVTGFDSPPRHRLPWVFFVIHFTILPSTSIAIHYRLTLTDEAENGHLNKRTILFPQPSCKPNFIFFTMTIHYRRLRVQKFSLAPCFPTRYSYFRYLRRTILLQ